MDDINILMECTVKIEDKFKEESLIESWSYEDVLQEELSSHCPEMGVQVAATMFQQSKGISWHSPLDATDDNLVEDSCSQKVAMTESLQQMQSNVNYAEPNTHALDTSRCTSKAVCSDSVVTSVKEATRRTSWAAELQQCNGSGGEEDFTRPLQISDCRWAEVDNLPFKCQECGKAFKSSGHLKRHQTVHTKERHVICEECGKGFVEMGALIKHKRTHTRERPFMCKLCGKTFIYSSNLSAHTRIHSGERRYQCSQCGKAFTHSSTLVTHERIHTGERPYKCEVCSRAFSQSSQLVMHKHIHTGERPFQCKHCCETFAHSSTLATHELRHVGVRFFQCEVCGKTFMLRNQLVRHKRIHTGEQPFQCKQCGKRFTHSVNLAIHEQIHAE